MRREIPIFRQISLDVGRSARELQVFWAATELLDLIDPRPLTLTALESLVLKQQREVGGRDATGLSRSTIAHALVQLEAAGYLIHSDEGYRIPLSRAAERVVADLPRETRRRPSRPVGVVSEVL